MANKAYATLQQLADPGYLGSTIISATGLNYGTTLMRMLESASEEIDHLTFRHFDCWEGTQYCDGSGITLILPDDLLSASEILLDLDGSAGYATTLLTTDYLMYPIGGPSLYPKLYLKATYANGYGGFAPGIRAGVKITGVWGHGDGQSATPYYASAINVTVATVGGTTLTLSADGVIQAGHTIRVESEQIYISALGTLSATAVRGVNGTTAAIHTSKTAYIYHYPGPVTEAALILATSWWKQRENPATYMAGDNITGSYTITKDIEKIVKSRLDHHIRRKLV